MTAMIDRYLPHEAMEPEVPVMNTVTDTEVTPAEVLQVSQILQAIEAEALVEADRGEKQEAVQQDEQTACPPIKYDSTTETVKWEVGARCRALWSEDGKIYPATVVAVDGDRCRVRFGGYDNEEDMDLSVLQSPCAVVQTQNSQLQDWKPGSRCRAVYSEDGLVYPAVILWVKDQRCRVRYDKYNNEEELDVSSLLHLDELRGPSGAGGATKAEIKERTENQTKVEKETTEKRKGDLTNNLFPPFAPQVGSMDPLSFIPPPPPPVWTFCGKEPGDGPDVNSITNMLMLWYMCGFHTGSYLTQQRSKSSSKD
ncbi:survival of motor neuron protein-like isoform X2 [Girardinichthys multiradiatus]|uniref:survival of motor neuron protein-like isoform X2 n=1 Tax=Girardinichthys multiradiatus TaxID=208333 RepID=UPI001FAE3A72|nr:survival of motor neuron protein-like isoform X2 [Girardinichthys multiradiatus]